MIATSDHNPKIPEKKNTGALGNLGNKKQTYVITSNLFPMNWEQ
jgi:hypothetical protein